MVVMGVIIGRFAHAAQPLEDIAGRPPTLDVRRSDDNSRRKVQNVREDSSAKNCRRSANPRPNLFDEFGTESVIDLVGADSVGDRNHFW